MKINSMCPFDFESLPRFEKTAPPLRQFFARDGETLSYRFYDSREEKRAIILLHGSCAHGEYLHDFANYLSSHKCIGNVYVPNLRGHYGSGNRRGDCNYIGQLEDDIYDLIHHLQLENKTIILMGHSSGGGLAIRVAGGPHQNLIHGYVLLSPAIPTAPTMRQGNAGGWATVSIIKIICLSVLNSMGIKKWNHTNVIQFNKPQKYCDGKETLSYTFNLNCSYHPRLPYQNDIKALKNKFIVFIGSEDEANDPLQFPIVMGTSSSKNIQVMKGVKHLDIVCNEQVMNDTAAWIENLTT
ncbi:MAG TPA: alpha/beta fold hydrolase [Parachlamydiaceae bacterium]|nr:alpha/beta fold hydrolase [Parachlamydiaceae bacterium]